MITFKESTFVLVLFSLILMSGCVAMKSGEDSSYVDAALVSHPVVGPTAKLPTKHLTRVGFDQQPVQQPDQGS